MIQSNTIAPAINRLLQLHARGNTTRVVSYFSSSTQQHVISDKCFSNKESILKIKKACALYRQKNYSQEIPSRFRKDIIKAADFNRDGLVSFHEVQDFMQNIGVKDVVTTKELETVFLEAGAHLSSEEENNQDKSKVNTSSSISSMVLPVDRMVDLFWCDVKDKHHDRPKAA